MKALSLGSPVRLSIICLLLLLMIISISPPRSVSSAKAIQPIAKQHLQFSLLSTKEPSFYNADNSMANNTFLTFQNSSTLGMTIKYPNNWKTTLASNKALILQPPLDKDSYSEILVIALFGISTNVSVSQLSDHAIKNYGAYYSDFYILNLKPISFQGKPAYLLLYSYTNPTAGRIITMDIGIKDGSKVYLISYSAEQQEYYTYMPTIEKMINSFRLV